MGKRRWTKTKQGKKKSDFSQIALLSYLSTSKSLARKERRIYLNAWRWLLVTATSYELYHISTTAVFFKFSFSNTFVYLLPFFTVKQLLVCWKDASCQYFCQTDTSQICKSPHFWWWIPHCMCDRINYCQQYLHSDSMGQLYRETGKVKGTVTAQLPHCGI